MRLFLLIICVMCANFADAAAGIEEDLKELKVTVVTPSPLVGNAALLVSGDDNKTYEWLRTVVPSSNKEEKSYKMSISFLINASDKKHVRGIRFIRPGEVPVSLGIPVDTWFRLFDLRS